MVIKGRILKVICLVTVFIAIALPSHGQIKEVNINQILVLKVDSIQIDMYDGRWSTDTGYVLFFKLNNLTNDTLTLGIHTCPSYSDYEMKLKDSIHFFNGNVIGCVCTSVDYYTILPRDSILIQDNVFLWPYLLDSNINFINFRIPLENKYPYFEVCNLVSTGTNNILTFNGNTKFIMKRSRYLSKREKRKIARELRKEVKR